MIWELLEILGDYKCKQRAVNLYMVTILSQNTQNVQKNINKIRKSTEAISKQNK
jgi:hypothetical protein